MVSEAGGVVLVPSAGTVDAALFGSASPGLTGDGELAIVTFRALRDGDPALRLASTIARDADNHPVTLGATSAPPPVVPSVTLLGPVFPNPTQGQLDVSFSLARDAHVSVAVLDVAGRVVRHLDDGMRSAGLHVVLWDGRDGSGRAAPSGFYIVRFEAGEIRQTRRVQLIR